MQPTFQCVVQRKQEKQNRKSFPSYVGDVHSDSDLLNLKVNNTTTSSNIRKSGEKREKVKLLTTLFHICPPPFQILIDYSKVHLPLNLYAIPFAQKPNTPSSYRPYANRQSLTSIPCVTAKKEFMRHC